VQKLGNNFVDVYTKAMKVDTFEDFLKKKKEEEPKINWERRQAQWIKSVTDFYNNVKKWLKPVTEKGLLVIKEDSWVHIYEDGFGDYDIKKIEIIVGKNNIITLTPRATLVLGGYGRIDMKGPMGEISIVQIKWGKWKFINKLTRNELWDANEETFKSVIQDLVNG
jgi:hypothetical protein